MKLSHSKVELYNLCPRKYKYQYIDKLGVDKTFSPLLFGSAIDRALNYVLTRTKRKHTVYLDTAKALFQDSMNAWHGQNELVYFKSELTDWVEDDEEGNQVRCWNNLCSVGKLMLETYVAEVLPLFKEIISVQTKKEVKNEEGDILVLVTDFTAKLHDDRVVTFDNKTASKPYPKNAVVTSQQLSIYTEYEETNLAGYIVLVKKLKDGKIDWHYLIDVIPDEQKEKAFIKIDNTLQALKREEFPKNEKSCFSFGKPCIYLAHCKYGNSKGLIQK